MASVSQGTRIAACSKQNVYGLDCQTCIIQTIFLSDKQSGYARVLERKSEI
jgi:hypothetical protein